MTKARTIIEKAKKELIEFCRFELLLIVNARQREGLYDKDEEVFSFDCDEYDVDTPTILTQTENTYDLESSYGVYELKSFTISVEDDNIVVVLTPEEDGFVDEDYTEEHNLNEFEIETIGNIADYLESLWLEVAHKK